MSENFQFRKATKKQARLRLALIGPPGSGKTYSAFNVATELCRLFAHAENRPLGRVAVIDTEGRRSELYADEFDFDGLFLEGSFHPRRYVEAIQTAERAGFEFLIVDSLSHAWIGTDGGLDLHDKAVARQKTKNTFTAWADVTPHHQALVQALMQCKCHLIVTLRSKVEYVQEKDANGRTTVRKVGTAPLMRDGLEYEFDVVGDMEIENNTLVISKTRCKALKGAVIREPGRPLAETLRAWLSDGVPAVEEPKPNAVAGPKTPAIVLGVALLHRLTEKDEALAKQYGVKQGSLLEKIRRAGHVKGFGKNIEDWSEEGYNLAVAETRELESRLKAATDKPREPGDDEPE